MRPAATCDAGRKGRPAVKSGADHLASLRDGRSIYLDGARVDDHTEHPAFRNAARSAAALYDLQAQPENLGWMTFESPATGGRVSRLWELPTSAAQLADRRRVLEALALRTCGMLGRSPDHVGSALSGMFMGIDLYERYDRRRAEALRDYYAYARDNDLYLSYVIINPQADRSKSASEQAHEFLACAVCDEDAEGITLKGAKMLGTAIPLANEVMVAAIQPLKPGEEKYSVTAMVPLNAPGLKLFSRASYEAAAKSEFDYPLSSRFDENDCVVYFDEVKVPWERVLVHNDVKMAADQWHAIPTHVYQNYQCQVRLTVKLSFLLGIARRIAETNGIAGFAPVRDTLGQLAAEVAMVEGLVAGMEISGFHYGRYWLPNRKMLYSAQVLTQQLYPDFVKTIRELAGGGLIMVPSSVADLVSPETAGFVTRFQSSPATDSYGRVKLMKLAWDALGSEFASRHLQYEMFYAGAPMVTRGHAYRTYDWDRATAMVDKFLASYSSEAEDSPRPASTDGE